MHDNLQTIGALVLMFLIGAPCVKILQRTGHSGWWVLLGLVPVVNLLALWTFAHKKWPAVDKAA
jgi:uncharacterized membrane protein YhaH (DUF805 family)